MLVQLASAQFCYVDSIYDLNNYIQARSYSSLKYSDDKFLIVSYGATTEYMIGLFAINAKGDTLWSKNYNIDTISTNYFIYKSAFDSSKNIIVAGSVFIDSLDGEQGMLLKFDSSGNLIWIKTYPAPWYGEYGGLYGYGPVITNTYHYLLVCQIGIDTFRSEILIITTDTNGNELNRSYYGSPIYETPWGGGIETRDSGFLIAGNTTRDDTVDNAYGTFSIYILKIDKNGVMQWDTSYPSIRDSYGHLLGDAEAYGMIEDTDGYIICGHRPNRDNEELCNIGVGPCAWDKCWVGKVNKNNGGLIWEKYYGTDTLWDANFTAIMTTADSNYVLCSKYDWNNYYANNAGIYKIDHNGDSLWSVFFSYHDNVNPGVILYAVNTINTSGYLASGFVTPNNANPYPWVVIVDSNGYSPYQYTDTVTDIIVTSGDSVSFKIYPNPSSDYFLVSYQLGADNNTSFEIAVCNILGQTVYQQTLPMYSGLRKIEVSTWAGGVYMVYIKRNGGVLATSKFVKE